METFVLESPDSGPQKNHAPFYLNVIVLASLSIMIGLIWDISWHTSIGRDGLFSAPHLAIYLGGVVAGVFSGFRVLRITIAGTPIERSKSVRFWGIFYGSLGNLFCIWGAIAMLTSAPFDDWWHNTYGLDVTILSPPHTILLFGMITIQFGAVVSVLSFQNLQVNAEKSSVQKWSNVLIALSGGFILAMTFTMASEYLGRHEMHGVLFYQIAGFLFPLFLVSLSVASRSRWGATHPAIVYTLFLMIMNWVLPLFPATPRLGPVLNPITAFQPFEFPLLIVFPAILIDIITRRAQNKNAWIRAVLYGISFVLILLIVQWPFGSVLMASKGHWFFGTSQWYFGSDPNWEYRYAYGPWMISSLSEWFVGIPIASAIAIISSRVGLSWGKWMKRIVR
ncbi:MAG TPA: hypothetical protein VK666_12275 [Chryseolinea sp.]|nr:hypothetical protein [Chryseolinea sp.]